MATKTNMYLKKGALTLAAIIKDDKYKFPVLVRTFPSDYEVPNEEDLPDDDDILVDKLEHLNIARVRVLPIFDEDVIRKTKGDALIKERKKIEGQEFWISAEYRGQLKILKSSPRPRRFISIAQVLENCPRFVKVGGDMQSCLKGLRPGSGKLVPDSTILELHGVVEHDNMSDKYLKGTVGDCVYYFRDDQVANLVEVDDPGSYRLLELKQKGFPLPVQIMFNSMSSSDIILKHENKKYEAYALFHGPLELLQFVLCTHIIAWAKVEPGGDSVSRHLAMIPKPLWATLEVSVYETNGQEDTTKFLEANFTDYQENAWIREHLFVIPKREKQFYLTWLKRPNQYLSVSEYDLPAEDCTKPSAASPPSTPNCSSGAAAQKTGAGPEVPSRKNPKPPVQLPTSSKSKDSTWVEKWHEKAKLGFDKIHKEILSKKSVWGSKIKERAFELRDLGEKQLTKLTKKRPSVASINNTETEAERCEKSNPQPPSTPPSPSANVPQSSQRRKPIHSESMRTRPLPRIPKEEKSPLNRAGNTRNTAYEDRKTQYGVMETAGNWQLNEDFYSFTLFEVHECMKHCFQHNPKVADMCLKDKLDGNFFRQCGLDKFCQAVGLEGLQEIKMTQIVKGGWRPTF